MDGPGHKRDAHASGCRATQHVPCLSQRRLAICPCSSGATVNSLTCVTTWLLPSMAAEVSSWLADVYTRLTPDMQRDTAHAIDAALFGT
jgi:hypothetical protein